MFKIIKNNWEHILIYGYIFLFVGSIIIFFVGYFWAFNISSYNEFNENSLHLNVSKLLSTEYEWVLGSASGSNNMFQLNQNLSNGLGNPQIDYGTAIAMTRCAIAGFSLIMASLIIFVLMLISTVTYDAIVAIKNRKSKNA